jgi:hypothetical protein
MSEVIETFAAGIQHQKINDQYIKVYVDGSGSVNKFRIGGTHNLVGKVPAPPVLLQSALPKTKEDLAVIESVVESLINSNELEVVAPIMGWMCANHLAPDLRMIFGQFPLLQLWGNAESGKTMTATLFSYLTGVDYFSPEETQINLTSTSEWATVAAASSTTSAVRIFDEFNLPMMGTQKYNKLVEILKSGWNGQSMSKGTIRKVLTEGKSRTGANLVEIPIIAPICFCSEQPTPVPALQQRSVTIGFSRKYIADAERKKAHKHAVVNRKALHSLAKAMMLHTLDKDSEDIGNNLLKWENELPLFDLGDRSTYSFATVLTGLDLMIDTLKELEAQDSLINMVKELQEGYVQHINASTTRISREKTWSEIDTVIAEMITMFYLTGDGSDIGLIQGRHFIVADDKLYLDPIICHAMYLRFASRANNTIIIQKPKDFITLLSQEKYCDGVGVKIPEMGPRKMAVLDLEELKHKGHSVEYLS